MPVIAPSDFSVMAIPTLFVIVAVSILVGFVLVVEVVVVVIMVVVAILVVVGSSPKATLKIGTYYEIEFWSLYSTHNVTQPDTLPQFM